MKITIFCLLILLLGCSSKTSLLDSEFGSDIDTLIICDTVLKTKIDTLVVIDKEIVVETKVITDTVIQKDTIRIGNELSATGIYANIMADFSWNASANCFQLNLKGYVLNTTGEAFSVTKVTLGYLDVPIFQETNDIVTFSSVLNIHAHPDSLGLVIKTSAGTIKGSAAFMSSDICIESELTPYYKNVTLDSEKGMVFDCRDNIGVTWKSKQFDGYCVDFDYSGDQYYSGNSFSEHVDTLVYTNSVVFDESYFYAGDGEITNVTITPYSGSVSTSKKPNLFGAGTGYFAIFGEGIVARDVITVEY